MDFEKLRQQLRVNNENNETTKTPDNASAVQDDKQSSIPCHFDDDIPEPPIDPYPVEHEIDLLKDDPGTTHSIDLEKLQGLLRQGKPTTPLEDALNSPEVIKLDDDEPPLTPTCSRSGIQLLDLGAKRKRNKSWADYWDNSLTYPENLLNITRETFVTSDEFLYPLISAYLMFPSALTDRVPILFFYGKEGTGKSTIGQLGCKAHGNKPITGESSAAYLRRVLEKQRFLYPQTKEYEQNVLMVYEDLDENVLSANSETYRILKLGYDRLSGFIGRASEQQGEVIEQFIYCPKILSSTRPLFNIDKELERRTLVVKTEKCDGIRKPSIPIHSINWNGFEFELKRYWNTIENVKRFIDIRDTLEHSLDLNSSDFAVLHDLSTVMVSCGYVAMNEINDYWKQYLQYRQDIVSGNANSLAKLLLGYMAEHKRKALNNPFMPQNCEASYVDIAIDGWLQQRVILTKPRPKELEQTMSQIGYKLAAIDGKGYWVEI